VVSKKQNFILDTLKQKKTKALSFKKLEKMTFDDKFSMEPII